MNQIRYLCRNIWEVEWSGVLFYSVEGEFGKPNFKCKAEHVHPMNKGTQAYTEFETDDSVTEFIMDNTEYTQYQRGLIHSHNSMNTFFSGTDIDEIKENSEFYNYYLSLIINNKGEMCAKIAFRGKNKEEVKRNISFKGTNGIVGTTVINEKVEKDVVFTYNCDIIETEELVDGTYKERVAEIIKMAEAKKLETSKKVGDFRFDRSGSYGKGQPFTSEFENFEWNEIKKENAELLQSYDIVTLGFLSTLINLDPLSTEKVGKSLTSIRDKFGVSKNAKNEVNVNLYVSTVCSNFQSIYSAYYDDVLNESLETVLGECIEILEDYSYGNWIADELSVALTVMQEQLEEMQTK